MRILFLTHRTPYPPDKGEKIRAFHELKHQCAHHEVDLFCLADAADELRHADQLKQFCRSVSITVTGKIGRLLRGGRSFVCGRPISFGHFECPELQRAVAEALSRQNYDLIFVNCSSMAQYVPASCRIPMVVDFVDADSNKFFQYAAASGAPLSWLYASEGRRVAEAERQISARAELSLVVTANDAAELGQGKCSTAKVKVVPMGVELPAVTAESETLIAQHQPFVVFLGTMSYRPNADAAAYFAEEIYPLVRRHTPQLKFVIAGRGAGRSVRNLQRIPGVIVTGEVPNAFAYFRASQVSVAPFRISQGFQSKIAESLAVGTPVVASRRAASAIGLSEKEGLFVAEGAAEFAGKICELMNDARLRSALRSNAPSVQEKLRWSSRLNCLDAWLRQAAGQQIEEAEASVRPGYVPAHDEHANVACS